MENKAKKRNGRKNTKGKLLISVLLFSQVILLSGRIVYTRILNDEGMGYYAGIYELFAFVVLIIGGGLPNAMENLVKERMRRGSFRSAGKIFKTARLTALLTGLLCAAGLILLSEWLAGEVLMEPLNNLAAAVIAPAVVFSALCGVYRGYFQGMGTVVPTCISSVLQQVSAFAAGLAGLFVLKGYGEKAGLLVQNPSYGPLYGIVGLCAGTVAAQLLTLLFLMFVNRSFAGTFKKQMNQDKSGTPERFGTAAAGVAGAGFLSALLLFPYLSYHFVDFVLFCHAGKVQAHGNFIPIYGAYYGKYGTLTGIAAILLVMTVVRPMTGAAGSYRRKNSRLAKDFLTDCIHFLTLFAFPLTVFAALMAEPVLKLLFGTVPAGLVMLLQEGSAFLIFAPFGVLFGLLLQGIGKTGIAVRNGLIAFAVHIAALAVMLNNMKSGIFACLYAVLALFFAMTVLNAVSVCKYFRYIPDFLRIFAVPAAASAVMGLVLVFVQRGLVKILDSGILLLIGAVLSIVVYNAVLLLLKGVSEKELNRMPGGALLARIGRLTHLL